MINVHAFRLAVHEHGFLEADEYHWGNTIWFMKPPPKSVSDRPVRLCIDSQTGSVTVFWQSSCAKLSSKTFRTVDSLKEWLRSRPN
jgi:hypothetical protein